MSFDLAALTAAVAAQGRVARVVVTSVQGSAPREVGASMLVFATGQSGTIGGGALEHQAAMTARTLLVSGGAAHGGRLDRHALGPDLGQCCGGAVGLVTEVWDAVRLTAGGTADNGLIARALTVPGKEKPLSVRRAIARTRAGQAPSLALIDGWLVEPLALPHRTLWVWGAGHVGRAVVDVLAPLPLMRIVWADFAHERFPEAIPEGVVIRVAPNPADLVPDAGPEAEHLILTHSHTLDLALCHGLLGQAQRGIGLIGSASKWARFRGRLRALGHPDARTSTIVCPIGDPALGKHPQAIALGVATALLRNDADRVRRESAG